MYLGSWKIDDLLTFAANTHAADTGAATDADAVPAYRVYEDETGTAILTGNMAKLDDTNTTGFYSEQITLSAANGFEKGKCYTIYISAAVSTVTGTMHHTFQIEAEVDANTVSGTVTPADGSITAAKIATDAFTAAKFASDVTTEFQNGLATAAALATVDSNVDAILVDTGTDIPAALTAIDNFLDTEVAAILEDTGTTLPATLATIEGKIDTIDSNVDAILVDTGTDIPASIAALNDLSAADILGATVTEGFSTAGSDPTLAQILHEIRQGTLEFAISGTTLTVKKQDGSTTAMTFTLDDATNPTSRTRAT